MPLSANGTYFCLVYVAYKASSAFSVVHVILISLKKALGSLKTILLSLISGVSLCVSMVNSPHQSLQPDHNLIITLQETGLNMPSGPTYKIDVLILSNLCKFGL